MGSSTIGLLGTVRSGGDYANPIEPSEWGYPKHRDTRSRDYSIADIATYPWVARYEWHKTRLEDFPNVKRWILAIKARQGVSVTNGWISTRLCLRLDQQELVRLKIISMTKDFHACRACF